MWPDNWPYIKLFDALGTQWRTSYGGPTGIDYGVLPGVLRMMKFPRSDWNEAFEMVRLMESAALKEIHGLTDDG